MDYYAIVGMVVIAFIALFGFLHSFKKSTEDEKKPMQELNNSIIRLNVNFENMLKNDQIRDNRIRIHGKEIDELDDRLNEVEHEQSNPETSISSLERWREKQ